MGTPVYSVIIEPVSARSRLIEDLTSLLHETLRLVLPEPPLTADEPLFGGRLGLDSVDSLQWVTAIERRYGCQLSSSDLATGAVESLGQMADTLLTRGITPTVSEP